MLKVVGALLYFVLQIHVAVQQLAALLASISPDQVIDVVHTLQVHGQALQAVGDLAREGRQSIPPTC